MSARKRKVESTRTTEFITRSLSAVDEIAVQVVNCEGTVHQSHDSGLRFILSEETPGEFRV
jgi:hypothetical protein